MHELGEFDCELGPIQLECGILEGTLTPSLLGTAEFDLVGLVEQSQNILRDGDIKLLLDGHGPLLDREMTPVLEQLRVNQFLLELRRQHLEARSDLLLPDREVKATRSELLNQSADRLWRKTEDLADLHQGESWLSEVSGGAKVDGNDQALLLR